MTLDVEGVAEDGAGSIGLTDRLDRACLAPPGLSEGNVNTRSVSTPVGLRPAECLQGLRTQSDNNPGRCIDRMSVPGQKAKSEAAFVMSALPPGTDILWRVWHFRDVPTTDIGGVWIAGAIWHIAMPVEEPSTAS